MRNEGANVRDAYFSLNDHLKDITGNLQGRVETRCGLGHISANVKNESQGFLQAEQHGSLVFCRHRPRTFV